MGKAIETALKLKENYNTSNPFVLCDYLDICYLFLELPDQVKGFYSLVGGSRIIFISTNVEENDKNIVCAHELGHALLHEKSNAIFLAEKTYCLCGKFEHEADVFAAYLLLDDIENSVQDTITLQNIACETGLPQHIIDIRYMNKIIN